MYCIYVLYLQYEYSNSCTASIQLLLRYCCKYNLYTIAAIYYMFVFVGGIYGCLAECFAVHGFTLMAFWV